MTLPVAYGLNLRQSRRRTASERAEVGRAAARPSPAVPRACLPTRSARGSAGVPSSSTPCGVDRRCACCRRDWGMRRGMLRGDSPLRDAPPPQQPAYRIRAAWGGGGARASLFASQASAARAAPPRRACVSARDGAAQSAPGARELRTRRRARSRTHASKSAR
jgi:hypothetical protein